jgi:hypothetical protein
VLISPEDLAELEETLSVLADPQALADIREADASYQRGDPSRAGWCRLFGRGACPTGDLLMDSARDSGAKRP